MNRAGRAVSRTRDLTIALAAVALIVFLGAAGALIYSFATPHQPAAFPNSFYNGYYTPKDALGAGGAAIEEGGYRLGYTVDVRFESADPAARVECGLIDGAHAISAGNPTNSFRSARGTGKLTRLQFIGVYDMQHTTVRLRCSPSVAGQLSLAITNVQVLIDRQ